MKKNNLLARYDKHLRIHMHYPEARKEVTPDVVRFVRKSPGMNFVSFTFATEQNLDRVIDQQVDYFLPMQQPFTWKVYDHDLLPSLKDKLATRGFAGDDDPAAVMILRVKKAPAALFERLTTVPGARRSGKTDIRRITGREGLKDIIHVLDRVYGGHN